MRGSSVRGREKEEKELIREKTSEKSCRKSLFSSYAIDKDLF